MKNGEDATTEVNLDLDMAMYLHAATACPVSKLFGL